jgi:hypothetical protein
VADEGLDQIHDVLAFSQFRLKLIEFLKLPLNVSESALRKVLKAASPHVYRNYLERAKRVEATLGPAAPDTDKRDGQ